jgi:hypothetical protein
LTNTSIKINILVQGIFEEYNGQYSVSIPVVEDEENVYSYNGEPIFSNKYGTKCIWKLDEETWLIGNCSAIGEDYSFALMKDCKCPWAR